MSTATTSAAHLEKRNGRNILFNAPSGPADTWDASRSTITAENGVFVIERQGKIVVVDGLDSRPMPILFIL
jgi:hypothetical protein